MNDWNTWCLGATIGAVIDTALNPVLFSRGGLFFQITKHSKQLLPGYQADDPHCRKPLMWKVFSFEKETRNNYQPGKKNYDTIAFNQQQFNWYKKLIAIRKSNPALSDGKFDFMITEGKKLGYKRYNDTNELIVLFNLENKKETFILPSAKYIDLLSNRIFTGKNIILNSLSAAVLKKIK